MSVESYVVVAAVALAASALTFFTGFGLGTLLLPALNRAREPRPPTFPSHRAPCWSSSRLTCGPSPRN